MRHSPPRLWCLRDPHSHTRPRRWLVGMAAVRAAEHSLSCVRCLDPEHGQARHLSARGVYSRTLAGESDDQARAAGGGERVSGGYCIGCGNFYRDRDLRSIHGSTAMEYDASLFRSMGGPGRALYWCPGCFEREFPELAAKYGAAPKRVNP